MPAPHSFIAQYDYVDLTVAQEGHYWKLTLRDNRHQETVVHEDQFATADEARDAAVAFAQHHINIQHNDTLMLPARLTWRES